MTEDDGIKILDHRISKWATVNDQRKKRGPGIY